MKTIRLQIDKFLNLRVSILFFIVFSLFLALVAVAPGKGLTTNQSALFGTASFLFSIYLGFMINNQRSRYDELFSVDRTESSVLYSIYMLSRELPEEHYRAIQRLIDAYLIEQLDYLLEDYQETDDAFTKLTEYCLDMKVNTEKARFAKDKIADLLPQEQDKRYQMQSLLKEKVSTSEWITLTGLYAVTLYFILSFRAENLIALLVVCLLSTAATLLLLILHKYNSLTWNAQDKIFTPLEHLFIQMDLLPYYSKPAIDKGHAKPTPGQKVRVASYPNPYPDFSNKRVEVTSF